MGPAPLAPLQNRLIPFFYRLIPFFFYWQKCHGHEIEIHGLVITTRFGSICNIWSVCSKRSLHWFAGSDGSGFIMCRFFDMKGLLCVFELSLRQFRTGPLERVFKIICIFFYLINLSTWDSEHNVTVLSNPINIIT